MARGVVIAAPASGSGKTVVTLGILRALRNRGVRIASAKVGPDYIDPRFHDAASGCACFNLDPWAMGATLIETYFDTLAADAAVIVIEGVMGLFDSPPGCPGSTYDLARKLGLPLVMVIDCSHMAQSVGALACGFERAAGQSLGIILNRVASARHERLLSVGLNAQGIRNLGAVYRDETLSLTSRHLGLVQAIEHAELELFIERAASAMERALDIDALLELCAEHETSTASCPRYLSPLGQRVAVARDRACAFIYPHVLDDWRRQGAEILPFSPLADEPPPVAADAIFLPGGYPELHAGKLARSETFLSGLSEAAQSGKLIYGECGGFMILGEYLIDAEGERHRMAGLLPLGTSFAQRKLHLGYRMLEPVSQMPWSVALRGHEFHYSTVDWQGEADPLFEASGVSEGPLGKFGLRRGNVMGSYAHVIAPEAQ